MLLLSFLKGTGPVWWVKVAQSKEGTNSQVYLPACVLDYRRSERMVTEIGCRPSQHVRVQLCVINQQSVAAARMCTRLQEVRSEGMSLVCVNLQNLTAGLGLQTHDWQIGGQHGKTARKIMDDQELLQGRDLVPILSKCQSSQKALGVDSGTEVSRHFWSRRQEDRGVAG